MHEYLHGKRPSIDGIVLGFDFGTRQIGVATSQWSTGFASPLVTIQAKDGIPNNKSIDEIVSEWQPHLIVVGLPLNMDDSETELTPRARKFARRLAQTYNVCTILVDERLTTRDAYNIASNNEPGKVDAVAAALIIETWLNSADGKWPPV